MINDKDESLENLIEEEISSLNICLICGYQKNKRNYGVFTCSSCKVFFRRNADLDLVF
jgi:ribosomal protein L37AE/L43A